MKPFADEPQAPRNPFSAERIRPGATPFLFPCGESADGLVARLCAAGWRGQIIGPHGSGKSALLAAILPAVGRAGRATLAVALHDGQRRLPREFLAAVGRLDHGLLAIDGYEQLSRWARLRLRWLCRRRGLGLLLTAHRPVGLPTLWTMGVDAALAWRVVGQLQEGFAPLIACDDLAGRLARFGPNFRETLFDLYDLYERRRKR